MNEIQLVGNKKNGTQEWAEKTVNPWPWMFTRDDITRGNISLPDTVTAGTELYRATLERHYNIFRAVLFSTSFTGPKIDSIKKGIKILCVYLNGSSYNQASYNEKRFVIEESKKFAMDELFYRYIIKEAYKKYNNINSESTWIVQYIYLNIKNLVREYRPRTISDGIDTRRDIHHNCNKNYIISYDKVEELINMDSSYGNPEDILSHKQLFYIMLDFFGWRDLNVLLGIISKKQIIIDYKFNYDQYSKHLYRKKLQFRIVLKQYGYDATC